MIVFKIHCNFSIVLSIRLEICRSKEFFFLTRRKVRDRKIERVLEILHARAHLIDIGCGICPGLHKKLLLFLSESLKTPEGVHLKVDF